MKLAKILYFVSGPAPSAAQLAEALEMNANVMFRNATAVPAEQHSIELCDGVAGDAPPLYADAYPTAEDAIAAKTAELKSLSDRVGDEAAPKLSTQQIAAAKKLDNQANANAQNQQSNSNQTAPAWNGGN